MERWLVKPLTQFHPPRLRLPCPAGMMSPFYKIVLYIAFYAQAFHHLTSAAPVSPNALHWRRIPDNQGLEIRSIVGSVTQILDDPENIDFNLGSVPGVIDASGSESELEPLAALEASLESLADKSTELRNLIKNKIESLNPEAKTFVNGIIEKVRALKPKGDEKPNLVKLTEAANEVIEQFAALSEEAKENLKATFPKLAGILTNLI